MPDKELTESEISLLSSMNGSQAWTVFVRQIQGKSERRLKEYADQIDHNKATIRGRDVLYGYRLAVRDMLNTVEQANSLRKISNIGKHP